MSRQAITQRRLTPRARRRRRQWRRRSLDHARVRSRSRTAMSYHVAAARAYGVMSRHHPTPAPPCPPHLRALRALRASSSLPSAPRRPPRFGALRVSAPLRPRGPEKERRGTIKNKTKTTYFAHAALRQEETKTKTNRTSRYPQNGVLASFVLCFVGTLISTTVPTQHPTPRRAHSTNCAAGFPDPGFSVVIVQ